MRPNGTPLCYCIFLSVGACIAEGLMNLGALLPSSMATYGTVGAGGKSVELVPYLMALPERASIVFRCLSGRGRASSGVDELFLPAGYVELAAAAADRFTNRLTYACSIVLTLPLGRVGLALLVTTSCRLERVQCASVLWPSSRASGHTTIGARRVALLYGFLSCLTCHSKWVRGRQIDFITSPIRCRVKTFIDHL